MNMSLFDKEDGILVIQEKIRCKDDRNKTTNWPQCDYFIQTTLTPWHAIAEFVDNSTQSYFDNRQALDAAYKAEGESG